MKTTLAILLASTSMAYADGPLSFTPEPLPPLTTPERATSFAGPYLGASVGYSAYSTTSVEYGIRDVTEDQCWKSWKGNEYYLPLPDVYCTPGAVYKPDLNQHYVANAVLHEDVVIGSEEYSYNATETHDSMAYSVFAGYLFDLGSNFYAGPEIEYTKTDFAEITEGKAILGYGIGTLMPYIYAGHSNHGMSYGGGAEWLVTNSMTVGVEHSVYESFDVTSVRVAGRF